MFAVDRETLQDVAGFCRDRVAPYVLETETADGERYRVTFALERDPYMSPLEYVNEWTDCLGRVALREWPRNGWDPYPAKRPEWADGSARILRPMGWVLEPNVEVWWQAPDLADADNPETVRAHLQRAVMDVLEEGVGVATAEAEKLCTCCGQWAPAGTTSLGGIEPIPAEDVDYLAEIFADMAAELGGEVTYGTP